MNDDQYVHYVARAKGGLGCITVEMTAVDPAGRITLNCLGLWSDEHAKALKKTVDGIKNAGCVAGIQLAHAGRKASCTTPPENRGKPYTDERK